MVGVANSSGDHLIGSVALPRPVPPPRCALPHTGPFTTITPVPHPTQSTDPTYPTLPNIRTALVHDWLNQSGGAEVVLGVLHDLFPAAPIFTSIFDPARVPEAVAWPVRSTWMDRLPGIHAHHQPYLPLYPLAWSATRLEGYDLVLSNKSAFCHGVHTPRAVHVCYCLTPTRFVWESDEYLAHERIPAAGRLALRALLPLLRRWDLAAARRVDHFVAISTTVKERIARCYGRESTVIFPPVDLDRFNGADHPLPHADARSNGTARAGDYHLILARLVPYKRIDLAVEAFNQLGRNLVVVGDGRDRERLQRLAGPTVQFRGRLPQAEVVNLLADARGLVWPGVEDFGLAPVEAMALGRPVIARRAGGVTDTVVEGRTGIFFDQPEPAALAAAVLAADAVDWDIGIIRNHAAQFGRDVFERQLTQFLSEALANRRSGDCA